MRKLFLFAVAAMLTITTVRAQAACSVAAPCTTTSLTNNSMGPTVVTNSSGVQTAGPGTANIWRCTGSTTVCAATTWGTSVWVNLTAASPIPQTTTQSSYIDNSVSYGVTYSYIVTNTWTGGGTSGPSSPFVFAMPAAPSTAPGIPSSVTVVLKTS
jgi:hypothetical protein